MPDTHYEVAQIREIRREVGQFGGVMRLLFVAERVTPDDTDTIAMSTEFEWQKSDNLSVDQLEDTSRKLHTVVLQSLLANGWEPIGSDAHGRVMALRRAIETDEPIEEQAEPAGELSWQFTHPWRAGE